MIRMTLAAATAVDGAAPYRRDVPAAEVHLLDVGHFALDEAVDQIAAPMREFLPKQHLNA